eukprot:TRINITY_DN28722_c0_g1_i3.p3 TRINITY_DN28722_c0_g1~~TRINITY_DN28722_c0_g1_i3.p3  ORF type:complete len:196 (+),score=5.94 TRINITY_DN28722_c0_g1_i3:269-856(+)
MELMYQLQIIEGIYCTNNFFSGKASGSQLRQVHQQLFQRECVGQLSLIYCKVFDFQRYCLRVGFVGLAVVYVGVVCIIRGYQFITELYNNMFLDQESIQSLYCITLFFFSMLYTHCGFSVYVIFLLLCIDMYSFCYFDVTVVLMYCVVILNCRKLNSLYNLNFFIQKKKKKKKKDRKSTRLNSSHGIPTRLPFSA